MASSDELNAQLDRIFSKLVDHEESGGSLAVAVAHHVGGVAAAGSPPPTMRHRQGRGGAALRPIAGTEAGSGEIVGRGDVEAHQPFRIRRTVNGHRLPPLPDHSFEVKLERSRSQLAQTERSIGNGADTQGPSGHHAPRVVGEAHRGIVGASGAQRGHRALQPLPGALPRAGGAKRPGRLSALSTLPAEATALPAAPAVDALPTAPPHGHHHHHPAVSSSDVHRRVCGLCAEEAVRQFGRRVDAIRLQEGTDRTALALEMALQRDGPLMDAWMALRQARDAARRQNEAVAHREQVYERQCDVLEELVTALHRSCRRDTITEWEVGFDEIAALERITLRHMHQIRDVHDRRLLRLQNEKETNEALASKRDEDRRQHNACMAQSAVMDDEAFGRGHIIKEEAAVSGAYEQVFREVKRRISDAESHLHALLARHAQKLQNIENEKEKLRSEEFTRRELTISTEKRAFEMMQLMEPESRRKELQKETTRLKRQAAERLVVEHGWREAQAETAETEGVEREALAKRYEDAAKKVAHRLARRVLNEQRTAFRQVLEADAAQGLLAEDNAAWQLVRLAFERALVYPCIEAEIHERAAMAAQKRTEKEFIWGLLRCRLCLNQEERRMREGIASTAASDFSVLEAIITQANNVASFLWYEQVSRRTVASEWEEAIHNVFEGYATSIAEAVALLQEHPKVRTDRATTSPDAPLGIWVRYGVLQWYWYADSIGLLEGSTARSNQAGQGGGTAAAVLADLPETEVAIELLNGDDGDRISFVDPNDPNDPLPIVSKKALRVVARAGSARDVFASFRYVNTASFSKKRLFPRILRVEFASVAFNVWVVPCAPLCPIPTDCVTTRIAAPLTPFTIPNHAEYKQCRLVLSLDAACGGGHKLSLAYPPEFTMHQKNGLMLHGKVLMRPKAVSDRRLELEFDAKPNSVLKTFLQHVVVQHGDESTPLLPLRLEVFLTRKLDGSVLKIVQQLDVDQELTNSPRLRTPGMDLFCRMPYTPVSEAVDAFLPVHPQHVLSSCSIAFPSDQPEVQGGRMKLVLTGDDGYTTLGVHCSMPSPGAPSFALDATRRHILYTYAPPVASSATGSTIASRMGSPQPSSLNAAALVERRSPNEASTLPHANRGQSAASLDVEALQRKGYTPLATVSGIDSTHLLLELRLDTQCSPDVVNHLLRTVTLTTTRTSLPKKGDVTMTLTLQADVGLSSDPIHAPFTVAVGPPVLECTARNAAFPYREGAGPKALPSLSMKVLGGVWQTLSPDAMLTVSIVSGCEASDQLDVLDCEVRPSDTDDGGRTVHVQNSLPVADVLRLGPSALQIALAGQFTGAPWLRTAINDAYSVGVTSQSMLSRYDVTPQHVNVLLRSITYNCNSDDPKEPKKVVLVTLDDGRCGRSSVALDLAIETVDDPTDILIDEPMVEYRQFSKKASVGCPILSSVRLEDIDSDNFHGGYIVVEHVSGPSEPGDHLYLLTPKQQELLLYRAKGKSSISHLHHLLLSVNDASTCMALATVVDEQPQFMLSLRDNRYMIMNGETIGQVAYKQTGPKEDRTTYSVRLSFASDSKFVSFPAAEYCLRCFGFENRSAKMNTLVRQYQITLNCTGLKSTADTVERVSVDGYVALLANPVFAANVKFEEGGKPKHILKQATTALHEALYQKGYLRASILNACDGDELQVDVVSNPDFKIRDGRTVVCGKENIANIASRKAQSSIHLDFLKMANASLQALVRSIVFNTINRMVDPTQRVVEIECCSGDEVDLCVVTMYVDIQRREEPVEFLPVPDAAPLLHMSGQPPTRLCAGTDLQFRKPLQSGVEIEVHLPERPKVGEHIAYVATDEVDLIEEEDAQKLFFWVNGKPIAVAQRPKVQEEDGAFLAASRTVTVTLLADVVALTDCKRILATLCYVNTCRADRGARKNIALAFKQRTTTIAKTVLSLEIVAPMLDFSMCNNVVHTQGSAVVAPAARLQIAPVLTQVTITVMAVAGYDFTDILSFKFPPNSPFGFAVSDDETALLVTNPLVIQNMTATQQQGKEATMGDATDVIFHVKALEPLLSNLSWATATGGGNWTVVMEQAYDVYAELSNTHEDIPSMLATVFARFQETWTPLLLVVLSWPLSILRNMVNVFDVVYECILFIFVYRYLTTLPHTVVYYLIAKMLTPLHAKLGARHARNIERDITISFRTLFQSFWHITWLHFSVTFCCFKFWGSPLPFCVGMIAVAMALFPLVPKWFSPCSVRLVYLLLTRLVWAGGAGDVALLHRVVDAELCMFAAALVVVVNDEWLLSVERGLHGSRQQDARGVLREQLPTFVIGTCIILGLVVYGLRGVLLGPLTVIVARTIFDNWDIMSGQLAASPIALPGSSASPEAGNSGRSGVGNASFATPPPSLLSRRRRGSVAAADDDDDAMSDASRGSNDVSRRKLPLSGAASSSAGDGYTVHQTDDVLQLKKRQ